MQTNNIFLASMFGGIVLFVWGAFSHMVLGLGESSIKQIPNEEIVVAAMRDNITEAGLYFFPGMERSSGMTEQQGKAAMDQWAEKWTAGPNGMLVYNREGSQPLSPKQFIVELISDIIAALIAAFLLAKAVGGLGGFWQRVQFVTALGLFSFFAVETAYWNWYGFPFRFTVDSLFDQVAGFFLAGLVLGWRVKTASAGG